MIALWVAIGSGLMLSVLALAVAARRARDEVATTVRAFEDFRAALRPLAAGDGPSAGLAAGPAGRPNRGAR